LLKPSPSLSLLLPGFSLSISSPCRGSRRERPPAIPRREVSLRRHRGRRRAGAQAAKSIDKAAANATTEALKAVKLEKASIEEELQAMIKSNGNVSAASREAFR